MRLLLVAHDPSSNTRAMAEAVIAGAREVAAGQVAIDHVRPLKACAEDVLASDAVILGTTENLGYMSGALKDFFDRSYYGLLDRTDALPFAFYVRAGQDGTGTRRAIESICGGLNWNLVQPPLICRGEWRTDFLDDCRELGQTMTAGLDCGIF
ncbi:MAG: flavodoxin family protein [Wenzhouxiangella sp.]|nr:flavodoxin family protein [Wenzhouxiangella sp.]